jgi:MoxR-like ATPase
MRDIIGVHYPEIRQELLNNALQVFYQLRDITGLKKKPSTSELLDWISLLLFDQLPAEALAEVDLKEQLPPHLHSLLKNEQDVNLLEDWKRRRR